MSRYNKQYKSFDLSYDLAHVLGERALVEQVTNRCFLTARWILSPSWLGTWASISMKSRDLLLLFRFTQIHSVCPTSKRVQDLQDHRSPPNLCSICVPISSQCSVSRGMIRPRGSCSLAPDTGRTVLYADGLWAPSTPCQPRTVAGKGSLLCIHPLLDPPQLALSRHKRTHQQKQVDKAAFVHEMNASLEHSCHSKSQ